MNILIHFRHFPVAMGRWFDWALRDLGHNVISAGCYNGNYIPWNGGMHLDYDFPPDIVTPDVPSYPLQDVLSKLPWEPDMILQAGDVSFLEGSSGSIPNVILTTDPHAVDYTIRLAHATHLAIMQNNYMNKYDFPKKIWIPYGYMEDLHKYMSMDKEYDVCLIGLQYGPRVEIMNILRDLGYNVYFSIGESYGDYVEKYNKSKIALNFSSKDDLPARFWEGLAMGNCVLTNEVPDLNDIDLEKDIHYMTFHSVPQAIDKVSYLLKNDRWYQYGQAGLCGIRKGKHTYKDRCEKLIEYVFNS